MTPTSSLPKDLEDSLFNRARNWLNGRFGTHTGREVWSKLGPADFDSLVSEFQSLLEQRNGMRCAEPGRSEWLPIESAPINAWHQLWNEDVGGWIGYWPANYVPDDPLPTHWAPYSPPTQVEPSTALNNSKDPVTREELREDLRVILEAEKPPHELADDVLAHFTITRKDPV